MPTEEDLEFERELILFKQRLEAGSLLSIIKKQIKSHLRVQQEQITTGKDGSEQQEDLSQLSASKKRKIKKKAKQAAEAQK